MQAVPEGVLHFTQKGKEMLLLWRHMFMHISSILFSKLTKNCPSCLRGSTTVGTAVTSTATAVRATSWPCPPTPDRCECATCATHSCCREARPPRPDKAIQHCTHSSSSLFFLKLNYQVSTGSHLI